MPTIPRGPAPLGRFVADQTLLEIRARHGIALMVQERIARKQAKEARYQDIIRQREEREAAERAAAAAELERDRAEFQAILDAED